jgi:transcriptional regulator with XRE-family HTH domain
MNMETTHSHVGQNIKRIAKVKGISVATISEQLNMTRGGVYDIFKRTRITDDVLLHRLAQILEVTVDDLLRHGPMPASGHEEIMLRFERAFREWKNENEFLKEQIKEKDLVIKTLLGKFKGAS